MPTPTPTPTTPADPWYRQGWVSPVFGITMIVLIIAVLVFARNINGSGGSGGSKGSGSSYCEQSWDTYVANGRPNNMSHSAYVDSCQEVRDALGN